MQKVDALPTYDVVIPCYNRAHVIADAVASVLAQTHAANQILLVDDCSTDNSFSMLQELTKQQPCVSAIRQIKNQGVSAARNAGAVRCRSPYIAFLDSDDMWLPSAAANLLSAMKDTQAEIAVGQFIRVELDGVAGAPELDWRDEDMNTLLEDRNVIGPSWSMLKRTAFDAAGQFDRILRTCEDWALYKTLAAQGCQFVKVPEPVALYRSMPGPRLMHDSYQLARDSRRVQTRKSALKL